MFLRIFDALQNARKLPKVTIDLRLEATAGNDPFYRRIVEAFYKDATSRHPKFPFIRKIEYGLALCVLPTEADGYYKAIEASARRNHKKALRQGCEFRRIEFNEHLNEIREVLRSTDYRQGRLMPEALRTGNVNLIEDPPSKTNLHAYPYYGVFLDGRLVGYMGAMISGEMGGIMQIYGHSEYLTLGVVPQLIIGFARDLQVNYPNVKYMTYGTFFGAEDSMKRFKKKFLLYPHRVEWRL